jgi:cob(I)alamin adenosyltransferase
METHFPEMTHFVLPADMRRCHINLRCELCRRAEHIAVHLSHNELVDNEAVKYLNRLSDYLFLYWL